MPEEQHENLKELLDFDPNAPEGSTRSIPNPKDERYGWPDDWKERFRRDAEKIKRVDTTVTFDEDSLFSIVSIPSANFTHRRFFRYRSDTSEFVPATDLEIVDDSSFGLGQELIFHTEGNHDYVYARFNSREDLVEFGKENIGNRDFRVYFDGEGNLNEATLGISERDSSGKVTRRVYGAYLRDGNTHGDLPLIHEIENDILKLKRMEGEEVKDEVEVPLHVNTSELKKLWFPDELVHNPSNPNVEFDKGYKGVDFLHEAGIEWTPIANDSYNSLLR